MRRILEGSESVLALFSENPFPDHPPRYVRLSYYQYHFADLAQKRRSGAWLPGGAAWMRYLPNPARIQALRAGAV